MDKSLIKVETVSPRLNIIYKENEVIFVRSQDSDMQKTNNYVKPMVFERCPVINMDKGKQTQGYVTTL